jgi:hypothetical protein
MGVLDGIGLDGAVTALVLFLAMRLTVQRVAGVDGRSTLLTQSLRALGLGFENPGGTDAGAIDDLADTLSGDAKLTPRSLEIVQPLIPFDHLVRVSFAPGHSVYFISHEHFLFTSRQLFGFGKLYAVANTMSKGCTNYAMVAATYPARWVSTACAFR